MPKTLRRRDIIERKIMQWLIHLCSELFYIGKVGIFDMQGLTGLLLPSKELAFALDLVNKILHGFIYAGSRYRLRFLTPSHHFF